MAGACCTVAARLTAEQLSELASRGTPLATLADAWGVPRSSLHRHRTKCRPSVETSTSNTNPRHLVSDAPRELPTVVGHTESPVQSRPNPGIAVGREDLEREKRIDTIADMVRMALWRNRGTTLAVASKWGITENEVNKLHRVACRRLANARGGATAQREHSVAVCLVIRDEMLDHAKRLDADAIGYRDAEEWKAAQVSANMAANARSTALQAQRQIDAWTQKEAVHVTVTQVAPDAEVWGLVRTMLEAWVPGLAARVDEGLGVYEDRGQRGFDEFVSEVAGDRGAIVVRGESVPG